MVRIVYIKKERNLRKARHFINELVDRKKEVVGGGGWRNKHEIRK